MNLEALERFVMDTIDLIFNNPGEYEVEAVKSTVTYRFSLHRGPTIKIHHLDPKLLDIEKPQVHRIKVEDFMTKSGAENTNDSSIKEGS